MMDAPPYSGVAALDARALLEMVVSGPRRCCYRLPGTPRSGGGGGGGAGGRPPGPRCPVGARDAFHRCSKRARG